MQAGRCAVGGAVRSPQPDENVKFKAIAGCSRFGGIPGNAGTAVWENVKGICNAEPKAAPLQGPHLQAPRARRADRHRLSECPNCHERKRPTRACPKCGTYKGREVLEVKEAK